jgi:hypothetical protein
LSRLGNVVVILLVTQVLVERSGIIVFDSSAGAITPSSSLHIVTGPTVGINI